MTRFKRFLLVAGIVFGFFLFVSNEVEVSMIMGLFVGLLSLPFDTKAERQEKQAARKAKEESRKREEEARKREKENRARSRKAPGCHSMDNVDILTFSSSNNLFTAGNNAISMRIRNKNSYDVIVSIRFKYSDSEGTQRLQRPLCVGHVTDVDLYHLGAFALSGVLDGHANLVLDILRLADVKRGIAQSVTEGVECLATEVAVGAVLHGVVQEVGQVIDTTVECYW